MTEEAGDAVQLLRQLIEVQPVRRGAFAHRHRGMAVHAERTEGALRLALPSLVHRPEHRVLGRVRVHAACPFGELVLVATGARLGVEELRPRQVCLLLRLRRPAACLQQSNHEGREHELGKVAHRR